MDYELDYFKTIIDLIVWADDAEIATKFWHFSDEKLAGHTEEYVFATHAFLAMAED